MNAPFDCNPHIYTVPPSEQLHFVIVQVSERRYVVAEWNGHAPLGSRPSYQRDGESHRRMQSACGFRVVSEPLTYGKACDRLDELYVERFAAKGEDAPILTGKV